jgi:hypothetical protein
MDMPLPGVGKKVTISLSVALGVFILLNVLLFDGLARDETRQVDLATLRRESVTVWKFWGLQVSQDVQMSETLTSVALSDARCRTGLTGKAVTDWRHSSLWDCVFRDLSWGHERRGYRVRKAAMDLRLFRLIRAKGEAAMPALRKIINRAAGDDFDSDGDIDKIVNEDFPDYSEAPESRRR